jgi:hypothetical protein
MKKIILLLFVLFITNKSFAQQTSFNTELSKFCAQALKDTNTINTERKILLNKIAQELINKKYVLFTCKTNSRRTQLLQAWAQASFMYSGLFNKFSLSTGDIITEVYPEVSNVLQASGFYCSYVDDGENKGYLVSVSKDMPINIILSKNYFGIIDTTYIVIVDVCFEEETSNITSSSPHYDLPYQSPSIYDRTPLEKKKYAELNKTIAIEMMYLAQKTKQLLIAQNKQAK